MLENIWGHSRGPPLRMPSLLPHDLCHEWNVSRRLPASELKGTNSDCDRREGHRVRQWRQKVKYLLGLRVLFLTWAYLAVPYSFMLLLPSP